MNMTPLQRRERIQQIAGADEEFRKMKASWEQAREAFDTFTDTLPASQRNLLQEYPGMGYLLYHRLLTVVCQHMRFPEEN